MIQQWLRNNLKGDYQIWVIVFIFSVWSMALVYSATGAMAFKAMQDPLKYLFKHAALTFAGLFLMWFVHRMEFGIFSVISLFLLWLSVPLLLYAFIKGYSSGGASRWITIPLINQTFQPSDLAKLALIARLAAMLSKNQKLKYTPKLMIPLILWCGIICMLIALTNFSTAAMLAFTCFVLMIIGRVDLKYLSMLIVICLTLGGIGLVAGQRFGTFMGRIGRFINSFSDTKGLDYQAQQAYIAITNGGWFGRGPGHSLQRNFLPEPFSDFIYATLIEEYGLLGGAVVLGLYIWLLYRGVKIVVESSRAFGALLSAGLASSLALQAMFHICVNVGLLPITGQPLPLISMGGTSMIFNCISIGLILSVSRAVEENKLV
jgi:cell division protein FtsW